MQHYHLHKDIMSDVLMCYRRKLSSRMRKDRRRASMWTQWRRHLMWVETTNRCTISLWVHLTMKVDLCESRGPAMVCRCCQLCTRGTTLLRHLTLWTAHHTYSTCRQQYPFYSPTVKRNIAPLWCTERLGDLILYVDVTRSVRLAVTALTLEGIATVMWQCLCIFWF